MRADQAIERAAGVAVDERKAGDEQVAHVHDVGLAKTDHDVGLGVRVRQVRELQVVVIEVQRGRVGEGDHRQCLARSRLDGRVGGWIHLRGAEPLAHVFLRDDHRARLAEGIVAAGVIAVKVRVDHELHRLVAEHGDGRADLRRHVGELVVDDGGAIHAHRETHVAAAAIEHVDARRQADRFDLDVLWRAASRRSASAQAWSVPMRIPCRRRPSPTANSPNFLFTFIPPLLRARALLHQSPQVGDMFVFGVGRAERHAHRPPVR